MTQRRRSLFAAAGAAVAAALLATSACGPSDTKAASDDGKAGAKAAASPKAKAGDGGSGGLKLPANLPTSIDDVKSWKWNDWSDWAEKKDFKNPRIQSLWTTARMQAAKGLTLDTAAASSSAGGGSPKRITAVKEPDPYRGLLRANGKIFFDTPQGHMVCSGTVVTDPKHPGKSNLVWTAGHCVHGGAHGGWYRNIVFVPAYDNNNGRRTAGQVAPYGQWWANLASTSAGWMKAPSAHTGSAAAAYDYAVLRVVPPRGVRKSLQEQVGAVTPWFSAPASKAASARGYPQAAPYNGQFLYRCSGRTGPVAMYSTKANQQWMGCSMTPGASGGGWFTRVKGKTYLVGNNSLTDAGHHWFSSPFLRTDAKRVWAAVYNHR